MKVTALCGKAAVSIVYTRAAPAAQPQLNIDSTHFASRCQIDTLGNFSEISTTCHIDTFGGSNIRNFGAKLEP